MGPDGDIREWPDSRSVRDLLQFAPNARARGVLAKRYRPRSSRNLQPISHPTWSAHFFRSLATLDQREHFRFRLLQVVEVRGKALLIRSL